MSLSMCYDAPDTKLNRRDTCFYHIAHKLSIQRARRMLVTMTMSFHGLLRRASLIQNMLILRAEFDVLNTGSEWLGDT